MAAEIFQIEPGKHHEEIRYGRRCHGGNPFIPFGLLLARTLASSS